MKPTLIQRLKARLLVSGHKKQQGVAILTVLAIITLMTVLVISFFNMARTAQTTAKGSVEIQRVTTMKDTIINLVIAQFREASRLTPTNQTQPRNIVTWTSQPGAIRTYSSTESDKNRLYKLYSSNVPQIGKIEPGVAGTSKLLDQVNEDLVPDWAERPDEFTDLNRPVYTSATGDRASATAASDKEGYSYPIVDPRAYNGRPEDRLINTEGFTFQERSRGKVIKGVDSKTGQLALPVRWIYQLQDGTLGYLNDSKEFSPLNGKESGEVSRTNPIVGRMAWWADDESCKINVNTASVPAIWDSPRTTSLEDVWLATRQPLAGEYQRYPGHPATVDLSAVFFPGRRYVTTDGTFDMPVGSTMKQPLGEDEANLIWDLAPFIVGNTTKGEIGTLGGARDAPPKGTTVTFERNDHLFTSLDEMYFKASSNTSAALSTPRDNLATLKKDPRGELLQRLERAQFFLTHKSHSPELTNQGFPRVSMIPMDTRATQYVTTNLTGALNGTVSPYDITMAVNSTIGKKVYYFQRRDPNSRHGEFYSTADAADPARNSNLFKYLKELSRLPIPGYPAGFPGNRPLQLSTKVPEDTDGLSFASKYPAAINPTTGKRYEDSGANKKNGYTLTDASDRTAILLNMLDYTRSLNMQPTFIATADRYDDGNGQATGICGCGYHWDSYHAQGMKLDQWKYRVPKGAGKLMAPAEIAMVVNYAAWAKGGQYFPNQTVWNQLKALIPTSSFSDDIANDAGADRAMVEIGFIMSGFNPKHGWSPTNPRGGIVISAAKETGGTNPLSAPGTVLPMVVDLNDGGLQDQVKTCATDVASSGLNSITGTPRKIASELIPYGGMQGPRAAMGAAGESAKNNFAICAPLCIKLPPGGAGGTVLKVGLAMQPGGVIRIMSMDGEYVAHNVTAVADLVLPSTFGSQINVNYTGASLRDQALKYSQNPQSTVFPDSKTFVSSFVIPHGDYRLATGYRTDADMYVAHQGYNNKLAHSFYESNINPAKRQMQAATYSPITMINKSKVPKYIGPGTGQPMSSLPLPLPDGTDMNDKAYNFFAFTSAYALNKGQKKIEQKMIDNTSREQSRRPTFSFGRMDGQGVNPRRGSSDPDETGDFDQGYGAAEDGPYMNYPDEGDRRINGNIPYFTKLNSQLKSGSGDGRAGQTISPNFLVRSPVDFGSIPTGLQARVPWQTLRFRPDPGMNDPEKAITDDSRQPPLGLPFANFCGPRDHFFLDMFWMPVVEPYSISEPFSTKGTINLNQQIFPFMYVNRLTALHALLRGERMMAIPNQAADVYKKVNADGSPNNKDGTYRYFVNAPETLTQFTMRYETGTDPEGFPLAFNTFRSASEICEVWLVPDRNGLNYEDGPDWKLKYIIGSRNNSGEPEGFWEEHRITGDNSRERPYANLYPRVTVRSNVFKLHMVAQTLQKARSSEPKQFDSLEDAVTAEWRGSCLIERSADSKDKSLEKIDYTDLDAQKLDPAKTPKVDRYYNYRVTEVKQLTQ